MGLRGSGRGKGPTRPLIPFTWGARYEEVQAWLREPERAQPPRCPPQAPPLLQARTRLKPFLSLPSFGSRLLNIQATCCSCPWAERFSTKPPGALSRRQCLAAATGRPSLSSDPYHGLALLNRKPREGPGVCVWELTQLGVRSAPGRSPSLGLFASPAPTPAPCAALLQCTSSVAILHPPSDILRIQAHSTPAGFCGYCRPRPLDQRDHNWGHLSPLANCSDYPSGTSLTAHKKTHTHTSANEQQPSMKKMHTQLLHTQPHLSSQHLTRNPPLPTCLHPPLPAAYASPVPKRGTGCLHVGQSAVLPCWCVSIHFCQHLLCMQWMQDSSTSSWPSVVVGSCKGQEQQQERGCVSSAPGKKAFPPPYPSPSLHLPHHFSQCPVSPWAHTDKTSSTAKTPQSTEAEVRSSRWPPPAWPWAPATSRASLKTPHASHVSP